MNWTEGAQILICLMTLLQPWWGVWYIFSRGGACFTSYWLCDVSEATVFKGKQKSQCVCVTSTWANTIWASLTSWSGQGPSGRSTNDITIKEWPCAGHQRPQCWNDPPGGKPALFLPPDCFYVLLISHVTSFLHDTSPNRKLFFYSHWTGRWIQELPMQSLTIFNINTNMIDSAFMLIFFGQLIPIQLQHKVGSNCCQLLLQIE